MLWETCNPSLGPKKYLWIYLPTSLPQHLSFGVRKKEYNLLCLFSLLDDSDELDDELDELVFSLINPFIVALILTTFLGTSF